MSTLNDFGIAGVGSGILQPRLKNRWRVTFANLGGGADSQPVSMQAIKVSRPKFNHEEVELRRYNSLAWVASRHTFEPMTMTLQDDVSGTASSVIQSQFQKQQWLIGAEGQWLATAGEGSLYKFATYLDLLDGNDQVTEKWTMEGCWIKDVDYAEMDYMAGDAVEISLTIRYDIARQVIGGYAQGAGSALGGQG
jgi:hypothetical protein